MERKHNIPKRTENSGAPAPLWTLIANGHAHATFVSLSKARKYAKRFFPNSVTSFVEVA